MFEHDGLPVTAAEDPFPIRSGESTGAHPQRHGRCGGTNHPRDSREPSAGRRNGEGACRDPSIRGFRRDRVVTDEIFSRIAGRYDVLNRVLSFGRDQAWRRGGARYLPDGRVLDLGAGTGAAMPVFGDRQVVAVDPVLEMLALNTAQAKVVAVGEALPFGDGTFDGVFSAYVFRNLTSVSDTLREVARVLRPGGVLVVIGLGRPKGRRSATIHRLGTSVVLPTIGVLAGARDEYTYLHRSLDKLPPPEELFSESPLDLERVWRMGPLGFVYGAVLRK
ncbi:MAG TPA: methyltransferase domain-containing protein [Actinobacteria bacterium]|nr:methyltransferase domain-containing protein [Actinomycetota bacterium]